MPRRSLIRLYQDEFRNYSFSKFQQDLLAGLTVAAVALPLALAFGVASGATAAAGLVTAILAGLIIGALSGAPYQISGPTGAMSAVLIVLAGRYGLDGIWVAAVLSGVLMLLIGMFKLGRFIAFIPAPVITGFTSGIALIIFIGQIDSFLGTTTRSAETALQKLVGFFQGSLAPNWAAVGLGLLVVTVMALLPRKIAARFPASLLGIILATLALISLNVDVAQIGEIPQTLLLAERFNPASFDWTHITDFISPTLTITALGAIESLLCGAVASNMTGIRLQANQELIGQGIGNIIIPFFGGVPATAAIARTSVGIKSGGQTRMVSIIHAIGLLLSMFLLAPVMARIPLSALAGVLMVTAWRMNEWHAIRFMFQRRFKTDIAAFLITMLATISLDLTQAILIGSFLAGGIFLNRIAQLDVSINRVDPLKLRERGLRTSSVFEDIHVAYVTGPLFFAATGAFNEAFATISKTRAIILSMRGVPLVDTAGIQVLHDLHQRLAAEGGQLMFAGVNPGVQSMLSRAGLVESIGEANFFWSSDQAILAAQILGESGPSRTD